ncbi:MAG: hypothetical protein HY670_04905 [Chloroflexi bacterium]|nr:hypothetical protein [Chloroflexota bacterium]
MLNALRERMVAHLAMNRVGMLAVSGPEGMCAMPVRYQTKDLAIDCLVPRWADAAYYVEETSKVLLVVPAAFPSHKDARICWLQYRGKARLMTTPDWSGLLPSGESPALAADLYKVIHLVPERIDLLDESQGWGARETLELDSAY